MRKYGKTSETYAKSKCKPYTERAFKIYAERDQGLTPDEAKAWWQLFYENPRVERDNGGPLGREQLYVPGFKTKGQYDTKYVDTSYEEGSTSKKTNPKERQVLMDQVHHSNTHIGDKFFRGPSSAEADPIEAEGEETSRKIKGNTPHQSV